MARLSGSISQRNRIGHPVLESRSLRYGRCIKKGEEKVYQKDNARRSKYGRYIKKIRGGEARTKGISKR